MGGSFIQFVEITSKYERKNRGRTGRVLELPSRAPTPTSHAVCETNGSLSFSVEVVVSRCRRSSVAWPTERFTSRAALEEEVSDESNTEVSLRECVCVSRGSYVSACLSCFLLFFCLCIYMPRGVLELIQQPLTAVRLYVTYDENGRCGKNRMETQQNMLPGTLLFMIGTYSSNDICRPVGDISKNNSLVM